MRIPLRRGPVLDPERGVGGTPEEAGPSPTNRNRPVRTEVRVDEDVDIVLAPREVVDRDDGRPGETPGDDALPRSAESVVVDDHEVR
jgi:hypothetical protein